MAEVKSMLHTVLLWGITVSGLSASECSQGFLLAIGTCRPNLLTAINQRHTKLIFTTNDTRLFLPLIDVY
jgi:hypothetical protein